ncbi:MAG: MBL fold metallo-hydrolase [Candidatus Paceibacterota bacterium]|jgi:competence protein ComEC
MNIRLKIAGVVVIAVCVATLFVYSFSVSSSVLRVWFLDVGQGDAALIQAPDLQQILIDGGPGKQVLRELGSVLPFWDTTIDTIILTHADSDHSAGLLPVLDIYTVTRIIDPGVSSDGELYTELRQRAEEKNVQWIYARAGQVIDLGGGVVLRIIFPDRNVSDVETNIGSVVARLEYGETEFLFTGDSPKQIEEYLVGVRKNYLHADVLKVGHHGSRTSTGQEFLNAVSPLYAVISAGKDNKFGHPHKEVVDELLAGHINILETFARGTIEFVSDGKTVNVE